MSLNRLVIPAFRAAAPAVIVAFSCTLIPAFPALAQNAAQPAHDPRIARIIETLGQGRSIHETDLSPDGNSIAWNVSGPGGGIKVAPLNDPAHPRDITACTGGAKGRESGMAWSPDSKHLAFFSDCTNEGKTGDKKTAIFLADPASKSAPRLLAPLNGFAEELQWSPDGKAIGFLYVEGATRPSGALAAMKPPSGVIGVEGLEIQRVAAVETATGQLVQLSPANLHVYEFDWSPDSQKLAYIAAPPPGENTWWVARLYSQVVGGAFAKDGLTFGPQVLFDPNTASGPLHGLQLAVPRWSPNGSQIGFISGLMSDQGSTGGDIYVIPSGGGEVKDVTPDRPASPAWFEWLDEHQLRIAEVKGGSSHLFVYDIAKQQESPDHNLTLPDIRRRGRARDASLGLQHQQHRLCPQLLLAATRSVGRQSHGSEADHPLQRRPEACMGQSRVFGVEE